MSTNKTLLNLNPLYIVLIICALFLTYWVTIGSENREITRKQQEKEEQLQLQTGRQKGLADCYEGARQKANNLWKQQCKVYGRKDNCTLSNTDADNIQKVNVSDKISCEQLWK